MRERAVAALKDLQDAICRSLEALDQGGLFQEDRWEREGGGGGRTRILADGRVFEKAGVNFSQVHGKLPPALLEKMQGDGDEFFATGVSLVLHPVNPHVPTTHANFRYIERGDSAWFGGGVDLTPYVLYEEDAAHFHGALADTCDAHNTDLYPRFKEWCDTYFYLPHRRETRGVGGIFFDYVKPSEEWPMDAVFAWWKSIGETFIPSYVPIAKRRKDTPYDEDLRTWQLRRRGRYVEFNLLYDRGTVFGLQTDGRIESILMSLPSPVRWDYDVQPTEPYQHALLKALGKPRDWRIDAP